ncbi:MAG TPA: AGE family epimerase/isomerase [Candidatus Ruania gallistercoris]|uniref:AGE family epimerase/isomerase n=1 Tax=Candidatus Ruania gallistercoris TaxID=2838746 RepID=A0A9D2EEB2_9MICO|nr:AGE family epimerase/isomerase [Candidatus Ruania gallistercoris]
MIADFEHRGEFRDQVESLLDFGRAAQVPGGFAWLDEQGRPTPGQPLRLYVAARMTHVYSLAALLGHPGASALAAHGLHSLETTFADGVHGGWYASVPGPEGGAGETTKAGYPHAFVMLAASSAATAGLPGAIELLARAEGLYLDRFWDEAQAMPVEDWDRTFTHCSTYRGANSSMHAVEAMVAVTEATGDPAWLDRAEAIAGRLMAVARRHDWRLPEHYDEHWKPDLTVGQDTPEDPVRPYGSTPGHGLEWARLLVQLQVADERAGRTPAEDWTAVAVALAERAVADGWAADGTDGFVYTVDFKGAPVVRARMHWVLCEALGTATVLGQRTGDAQYAHWFRQWWQFAQAHQIDTRRGSWHHELGPDLQPSARIRPGKADLYHAVQACLLPSLPLSGTLASAVRASQG